MITQEYLKSILHYCYLTGIFKWLKYRYGINPDWVAGNKTRSITYIQINIDGKIYYAHRLAWLYMTGEFPPQGMEVDHINKDKKDNRWCNLRVATRSQNQGNRYPKFLHDLKGVCYEKASNHWSGVIVENGVSIHLGTYEKIEHAAMAYDIAALDLFKEFSFLNYPTNDYSCLSLSEFKKQYALVRNTHIRKSKSGYRGVYPQGCCWYSIIKKDKQKYDLGIFSTKEEAALAYNKKALELYGEFAVLNVIKEIK